MLLDIFIVRDGVDGVAEAKESVGSTAMRLLDIDDSPEALQRQAEAINERYAVKKQSVQQPGNPGASWWMVRVPVRYLFIQNLYVSHYYFSVVKPGYMQKLWENFHPSHPLQSLTRIHPLRFLAARKSITRSRRSTLVLSRQTPRVQAIVGLNLRSKYEQ